ncbi:MAG: Ig-like domain-containing protein [Clostridium sp.]
MKRFLAGLIAVLMAITSVTPVFAESSSPTGNGSTTVTTPTDTPNNNLPNDNTEEPPKLNPEIVVGGVPSDGASVNKVEYSVGFKDCTKVSVNIEYNDYGRYYPYSSDISGTITRNGQYRITVKAKDANGSTLNYQRSFSVDSVNPTLNFYSDSNYYAIPFESLPIRTNKVNPFSVLISEDAVLYFNINGVDSSYKSKKNEKIVVPNLSEGENKISVYSVDNAGNKSEVYTKRITLKTTGPIIEISGVVEGGEYKSVSPVISVNEGKYEATIDGWKSFKSGDVISTDGNITLSVKATDNDGNVTKKVVKFRIDNTPPTISITQPVSYYEFSVMAPITINFSEEINLSTINASTIQLKNADTGRSEVIEFSSMTQKKSDSNYSNTHVVTIPINKLKEKSNYVLTINSKLIQDKVGNAVKTYYESDNVVKFKTRKYYGPVTVKSSNIDGGELGVTNKIEMNFSENILSNDLEKIAQRITLNNLTKGRVENVSVKYSDKKLYIDSKNGLSESCVYKIKIDRNAILSYDSVPMASDYEKEFKTSGLFNLLSKSPEGTCAEKRPGIKMNFSNPVDKKYINKSYFSLSESDNSNENKELDVSFRQENNGKTIVMIPDEPLKDDSSYTATVSDSIMDTYGVTLNSNEDIRFSFNTKIITKGAKPTDISWEQSSFTSIKLKFKDNSLGEDGYVVKVNNDDEQEIESVDGEGSYTEKEIILNEPLQDNSITIIPVINGDDNITDKVSISGVKLKLTKPSKAAEIKAKILSNGDIEWTWKDVPCDYKGENAYIMLRKSRFEKASMAKSSSGSYVEKIDYSKEKIIDNKIVRYISRCVNIEGQSGAPLESDMVKYTVKLPANPPKASVKKAEYSSEKISVDWVVSDIRRTATEFKVKLTNSQTGESIYSYDIKAEKGKNSYSINIMDYYQNVDKEVKYKVSVITKNSTGKEIESIAKELIFLD